MSLQISYPIVKFKVVQGTTLMYVRPVKDFRIECILSEG